MKDEEMAEEYLDEKCKDCYMCSYSEHKNPYKICQRRKDRKQAFLAGLKAGRPQWHDLEKDSNDLPTKELEEKQLLVRVRNYTEDYIFAYYMLDKYYSKNGKRFYSDTDCDYPIDIEDIIAWKEIVFPELKESKL